MRRLEICAAAQRQHASPAELALLPLLRTRGFIWQAVLAPFIVDFYNPALKLVIEVDGKFHAKQQDKDISRNQFLIDKYGVNIYRFRAQDCFTGGGAWRQIIRILKNRGYH